MAENKKSFVLYSDHKELFETLSDKDAAELIRHIFRYVSDENPISDNPIVNISFITIKLQLKRDLVKYEESKTSKAESGALGNLKRWNTDLYAKVIKDEITLAEAVIIAKCRKASQTIANIAVNVNDNVNVNVNGNVINKENNNSIVETSSTNDVNDSSFFETEETAFTPKPVNAKLPTVKKEKGAGAHVVKKVPSVFTACIEVYNQFMIQRTGLPGKFDGQEGKGMVAIVAYLASVSIEKTDQGTINSWRHILSLIEKWDPYHKNQLKLSQINSNLINIINSIKNGNSKQINNSYSTNKYRTPTGQQPVQ